MNAGTPDRPKQVMTALLLERKAPIDYRLLTEQVGGPLGIDASTALEVPPTGPMVLPADGEIILGMEMDFPYPGPMQDLAKFAYWWPNAVNDLARHKLHRCTGSSLPSGQP